MQSALRVWCRSAALVTVSLWGMALAACGGHECGSGTVEKDGVCLPPDDYVKCGAGFRVAGNQCVPVDDWVKNYCDPSSTLYDKGKCKSSISCGTNTELKDGKCVGKATVKPPPECTLKCPTAGNKICLSGRIYEAVSLVTQGRDSKDFIKPGDNIQVRVYDPLAFVATPGAKPLATGDIYNDGGCFMIADVTIPFSGFLALAIEDKEKADSFIFTAMGHTPTAGENSEGLTVPAIKTATADAWKKELGQDLVKQGAMLAWFRDVKTLKPVKGVSPTMDSKELPWSGYTAHFFDSDLTKSDYFDSKATKTTAAGLVAVPRAQLKDFSGNKAGCTIDSGLGGSSPGALFFRIYTVSGC